MYGAADSLSNATDVWSWGLIVDPRLDQRDRDLHFRQYAQGSRLYSRDEKTSEVWRSCGCRWEDVGQCGTELS